MPTATSLPVPTTRRPRPPIPSLLGGSAMPLASDAWNGTDFYSYNPRDAGMRVVLPGPAGEVQQYYVRVSSKSGTSGVYQLQIRLQETAEIPGSMVQYADIRYATEGVELYGLPTNSPLLANTGNTDGTGQEITGTVTVPNPNGTQTAQAQNIGNLLASSNGTITVAGHLSSLTDVNWYQFQLSYQDISDPAGTYSTFPTIFDINYASGMGRPDTVIWVFDSTGTLIYESDNSNIADNRPDPTQGTGLTDLSKGSVGAGDPYLGPVQLNEGPNQVDYVAVTGKGMTASAMQQSLLRQEPIDSINRVVEDHVSSTDGSQIADQQTQSLNLSPDPFSLSDVTMYVSTNDNLYTEDPFTGEFETQVTGLGNNFLPQTHVNPTLTYGDIAMRTDGELYSLTRYGQTATGATGRTTTAGQYDQLDTGDATTLDYSNWAGINTYELNAAGNGTQVYNSGISFEAMSLLPTDHVYGTVAAGNAETEVYAIGHDAAGRNTPNFGTGFPYPSDPAFQNLLYPLDITGATITPANTGGVRVGTDIIPLANLVTGQQIVMPALATNAALPFGNAGDVLDGQTFTITDSVGNQQTFEFDCGLDVGLSSQAGTLVNDGDTFTLTANGATKTFEFDDNGAVAAGNIAITFVPGECGTCWAAPSPPPSAARSGNRGSMRRRWWPLMLLVRLRVVGD